MKLSQAFHLAVVSILLLVHTACHDNQPVPGKGLIASLNLKKGALIACSPDDKQLGELSFNITGSEQSKQDFNLALKLLHSFEYDEVEKVCAKIIDAEPACAMAWWGIAMSNFHALWAPPTGSELEKGAKAVAIARSVSNKTAKEKDYIEAIGRFYDEHDNTDHHTRCVRFEEAMATLHEKYPDDKEAAVFYALALNAAADPADKNFKKQLQAGDLFNSLYPSQPNHPGIVHYIIHTYDYPELAARALPAARRYASVAPASAHALHMPSHIFTRLGLWDECIQSNLAAVQSAQCYAQAAGIRGHWDEELHGMDYLMYGYLQKGDNDSARKQLAYLKTIKEIHPANFKVAYAFAAIPARYVLENRLWPQAAALSLDTANIEWSKFPWQESIYHFARLMGAVHTNNRALAQIELSELKKREQQLIGEKDGYKAGQVTIQVKMAEAWMQWQRGNVDTGVAMMHEAADMEDKTEKHPVTPGEVIPARELLGDMLMQIRQWYRAGEAYEANLEKHPNRFNSLYGAALAAERAGNKAKAMDYYRRLFNISHGETGRPEMAAIEKIVHAQ